MREAICLTMCLFLCGCGGQYVLTVPDQLAPSGGEAPAVVRLQRSELGDYAPAVEGAAMRFQVAGCPLRGAYTDKLGYAAAPVPVPVATGRYSLTVSHMDRNGEECAGGGPVYVWPASRRLVAVELDCLPTTMAEARTARAAMMKVAKDAGVIYLTQRPVGDNPRIHAMLEANGYPDGPVLQWQREYWHVVSEGPASLPRVLVEHRMVGQLPEIKSKFPNLELGICASELAARSFVTSGLKCVYLGKTVPTGVAALACESWPRLNERGL